MTLSAWLATLGGCGLIAIVALMWLHGKTATSTTPPARIVKIELAGSGLLVFDLLDALGARGRDAVRRCISIDSGIIAGYAAVFVGFGLSAVIEGSRHAHDGVLLAVRVTGYMAAATGTFAALLDVAENRFLRKELAAWRDATGGTTDLATATSAGGRRLLVANEIDHDARRCATAARLKFTLIGIALVSLVASWTVIYAAR